MAAFSLWLAVIVLFPGVGRSDSDVLRTGTRCLRPEPGQSRIVQLRDRESLTGTGATYRLTRIANLNFLAELRLKFLPGPGYDLFLATEELQNLFLEKTKICLSLASPYLRDLKEGRDLEVRLADDPEIPEITIRVGGIDTETNSIFFASGVPCPVILHELFHHLGLPDEYAELDPGDHSHYDCRAIGPIDSLMNDCKSAAKGRLGSNKSLTNRKSLLYPAQFRAVTEPNCKERNRIFYSCAANAYRDSAKEGCLPASVLCQEGNAEWLGEGPVAPDVHARLKGKIGGN